MQKLLTKYDVKEATFRAIHIPFIGDFYKAEDVDDFVDNVEETIDMLSACFVDKDSKLLDSVVDKAYSTMLEKREKEIYGRL